MQESRVQARTNLPLGENRTEVTGALSSCTRVRRHWPVRVSQTRLVVGCVSFGRNGCLDMGGWEFFVLFYFSGEGDWVDS